MTQQRTLVIPAYLVSLALVLLPPVDQFIQLFPFRLGDPRWRFGAFGLVSNALLLPTIGLFLALAIATVFEHHRFRRVVGSIGFLIVLFLAVGVVLFGLDIFQVRRDVNAQALRAFYAASASAVLKTGVAALTLLAIGIASFRGAKPQVREKAQSQSLIRRPLRQGSSASDEKSVTNETTSDVQ